tara:strand:+ start:117 stop:446 length:330 start_codon:yes stop_codon:yes gene_type:complete
MPRITTYFAANSGASLESVCNALQSRLLLPDFHFDCHDSWRYASSQSKAIALNVTRASDSHTIETWMPACPTGVNFQIVAEFDSEPDGLADNLRDSLGADVIRYASLDA